MKLLHVVVATSCLALAACTKGEAPKKTSGEAPQKGWQPREANAPQPIRGATSQPAAAGAGLSGKVLETMNSGGYTYVHVEAAGKGKLWAAGPTATVKVGDTVSLPNGMLMENFASKTLGRTFERIYFVSGIQVAGGGAAAATPAHAPKPASQPASQPGAKAPHPTAKADVGKIEKAEGGLTVAEIFAKSAALSGKQVVLRGKVVKYNANIMGKNWLHVQDGTGAAGTNDLTVTTGGTAAVGDVVVLTGTLVTNKDFGAGYNYAVLLEDAKLSK